MKLKIHQFHSGSAYGDAVTNSLFFIQTMLLDMGFESTIFCEHVAPELKEKIEPYQSFIDADDVVLLLHHSMGHDRDEWILGLKCKIFLIYHNITPKEFFPDDSPFRHYSEKGLNQLLTFKHKFSGAIAVSPFNKNDLEKMGYENVAVIPMLFDSGSLTFKEYDDDIIQRESCYRNIIFVGRVAPNKCQTDIVKIMAYLSVIYPEYVRLILIGSYDEKYIDEIKALIKEYNIEDRVVITGKVSDKELFSWYRVADLFMSMSAHEGFGVPLIEAMSFGIPVIAFDSSNIAATLGGAGILVKEKNYGAVAALVSTIFNNQPLKRRIIEKQYKRAKFFSKNNIQQMILEFLLKHGMKANIDQTNSEGEEKLKFQIEGPFDSSYSLAIVNRNIALALNKYEESNVSLFSTEGGGDFQPNMSNLELMPEVMSLWKNSKKRSGAEVVIRNLYPPRVNDMDGDINLFAFAWEESSIPREWIQNFNMSLDGVLAISKYVKKTLRDNGFKQPIKVNSLGMDHLDGVVPDFSSFKKNEKFVFLHISSAFPRKGVDVLLSAYAKAFSANDNVVLVIKSFPNPHNTLVDDIKRLKVEFPMLGDIIHINEDLGLSKIKGLYLSCDAFVAPTRGEGFGLPMGEAMYLGKPVITTGYGGQTDFCTDETAWLIDYSFDFAKTHLNVSDSLWVEPSVDSLIEKMREVYSADSMDIQRKVLKGQELLKSEFTWKKAAERIIKFRDDIKNQTTIFGRKNIAWVSSWNTRCGIAAYSNFLLEHFDVGQFNIQILASKSAETITNDDKNVIRCWTDSNGNVKELIEQIERLCCDAVVIQYNYGFFSLKNLAKLITYFENKNIKIFLELHSTKEVDKPDFKASFETIKNELANATCILVHNLDDINRLKGWGLVDNVVLFPLGMIIRDNFYTHSRHEFQLDEKAFIVATYGFLLPHKGIEQMIEAFALLSKDIPQAKLMLVNAIYSDGASRNVLDRCNALIHSLDLQDRVTFCTEFLSEEESFKRLDCADVIVFPYQNTEESASAAVRHGLATMKPIFCTPIKIFSDVKEIVYFLDGTSPQEIYSGIKSYYTSGYLHSKREQQEKFIASRSFKTLSIRLQNIISGTLG